MAQSILQIIIQAVDKASGTLKQVGKTAQGMGKDFDNSSKGISLNFATIAKAAAVAGSVVIAAKKAWDFGKEGAAVQRLEVASTNLAKSYGGNMGAIVTAVREASFNSISQFDAMQSSSRAMMLGLGADTGQLSNLMEVAAFRARAMGVDTTQAFNDIVTGIGRKSRLILDNLGIIIDAEQAYKDYADAIGVSVDELDSQAQVQAYMNAVLKEGNALMQQAGGLSMDSAAAFERAEAAWGDYWRSVKVGVTEGLLPLITTSEEYQDIQSGIGKALAENAGDFDKYKKAMLRAAPKGTYIDPITGNLMRTGAEKEVVQYEYMITDLKWKTEQSLRAQSEAWRKHTTSVAGSSEEMQAAVNKWASRITTYKDGARVSTQQYNNELYLEIGLTQDIAKAQEKYNEEMEKAGRSTKKQAAAVENLNESYEDAILMMMGKAGATAEATMGVAYAFGEIDDTSIAVFGAISGLTQQFDKGAISLQEYVDGLVNVKNRIGLLNSEKLEDKEMTIKINFLMTGNYGYMPSGFTAIGTPKQQGGGSGIAALKQFGGEVQPGQAYIVGERRPELFVPNMPGRIEPSVRGGMGGGSINISFQYAPMISTASRQEAIEVIAPLIEDVIKDRTRGRVL